MKEKKRAVISVSHFFKLVELKNIWKALSTRLDVLSKTKQQSKTKPKKKEKNEMAQTG